MIALPRLRADGLLMTRLFYSGQNDEEITLTPHFLWQTENSQGASELYLHKTTERLGTDPLGKLLLRLSLPSVASMVIVSLYNLVNTFWVAKLGYQAIAALTVTMPFFIFCMALGAGTGVGVNAWPLFVTEYRINNQVTGNFFWLLSWAPS
jgi:hypothetical protein